MSSTFLNKKIYSECHSPIKIKVRNPITLEYEFRDVPCGKCYHCIITQVNEWVTRMVAESLYHKYMYFVTLTYDDTNTITFKETLPHKTKCNIFGKNVPTPILLRKAHLQKYLKRLRKNNNIKFKYYACGEYGHEFGRPHFHIIVWSDVPITHEQFQNAWYEGNIKLGNVDYDDLNSAGNKSKKHSFQYVCKYLQKSKFKFSKLPTYAYHRNNYAKLKNDLSIGQTIGVNKDIFSFEEYCKVFGPFQCCSKRSAIGYDYYQEHAERFKTQDFRLFGMPKNSVFPHYYYRKTKESLCPFKTYSPYSIQENNPTTCNNIIGYTSFCGILYHHLETYNTLRQSTISMYQGKCYNLERDSVIFGDYELPREFFDIYDCENHIKYKFNPDTIQYDAYSKNTYIDTYTFDSVVDMVANTYNKLLCDFLIPLYKKSKLISDLDKKEILSLYPSMEDYMYQKCIAIENLLKFINHKQELYNMKKNQF